jgi:hypothetical protein
LISSISMGSLRTNGFDDEAFVAPNFPIHRRVLREVRTRLEGPAPQN